MAKNKRESEKKTSDTPEKQVGNESKTLFSTKESTHDAAVASLFSSSSGPVVPPSRQRAPAQPAQKATSDAETNETSDEAVEIDEDNSDDADALEGLGTDSGDPDEPQSKSPSVNLSPSPTPARKRKRTQEDDDLEATYLSRLAREDRREELERQAEQVQLLEEGEQLSTEGNGQLDRASISSPPPPPPPQHETLAPTATDLVLEKAARTVFLSNISVSAVTSHSARKALLTHLSSHFSFLPSSNSAQKIESIRFRSTAYSTPLPKKAAFTRRELNESTSKSTNAYCVYNTKAAAREAAKRLNGTVVLDRHVRVDEVAHPAKVDHRRCVFVGNVGFVDDETALKASLASSEHPEDKKKAKSKPLKGDAEEGLWRQFEKAGPVESVRVVRDPKTRVGKGFAYVQFKEEYAVETALTFNEKKYPPMLPRKLRVVRCKKPSVTKRAQEGRGRTESTRRRHLGNAADAERTEKTNTEPALQGRLKKMLGRAGIAEMRGAGKRGQRAPLVFEGQRATNDQGNTGLRFSGGSKRKKSKGQASKRQERSNKRAASYKKLNQ